jgi:hypothetical protein
MTTTDGEEHGAWVSLGGKLKKEQTFSGGQEVRRVLR